MTDKTNKNQFKITPASHGDELDVYEAIYNMESEKGKKLLPPKQLEKLINSGRIRVKSNTEGDVAGFVSAVIDGIFEEIRLLIRGSVEASDRREIDEAGAKHATYTLFKREYGVDPQSYKDWLLKRFYEYKKDGENK